MAQREFATVRALINRTERGAARKPDSTALLADVIRMVTAANADPYIVLGVLIEGATHTIAEHIPPERRAETARSLAALLPDFMKAQGLLTD